MADDIHPLVASLIPADTRGTIIEVGCNIGQDTLELRKSFPAARIIAFEPDPRNVYYCKRCKMHEAVELIDAAVSDTDGTATFHLSDGHPPGAPKAVAPLGWSQSSSLKKPDQVFKAYPWLKFERKSTVRTVRLDTFCAEAKVEQVEFLWADVQGAEAELIAGAQQTLARTKYFFTEYGRDKYYEGELGPQEIHSRLPGQWGLVKIWDWDVLFCNLSLVPLPGDPRG